MWKKEYEEYSKNCAERQARVEKLKQKKQEVEKNLQASSTIDKYRDSVTQMTNKYERTEVIIDS